jgi:hypothetical protein
MSQQLDTALALIARVVSLKQERISYIFDLFRQRSALGSFFPMKKTKQSVITVRKLVDFK